MEYRIRKTKPGSINPARTRWRARAARVWDRLAITWMVAMASVSSTMAQEAVVRSFFTRASSFLVAIGPLVTLGCLFWGAANVLRERPAGKQWTAAAIFLAITILRGMLQGWWT